MKKTYNVDVDCANCALKVEDALKKVEGVEDCSINFMTLKMRVTYKDGVDENKVFKEMKKVGKRVESDFDIIE